MTGSFSWPVPVSFVCNVTVELGRAGWNRERFYSKLSSLCWGGARPVSLFYETNVLLGHLKEMRFVFVPQKHCGVTRMTKIEKVIWPQQSTVCRVRFHSNKMYLMSQGIQTEVCQAGVQGCVWVCVWLLSPVCGLFGAVICMAWVCYHGLFVCTVKNGDAQNSKNEKNLIWSSFLKSSMLKLCFP